VVELVDKPSGVVVCVEYLLLLSGRFSMVESAKSRHPDVFILIFFFPNFMFEPTLTGSTCTAAQALTAIIA